MLYPEWIDSLWRELTDLCDVYVVLRSGVSVVVKEELCLPYWDFPAVRSIEGEIVEIDDIVRIEIRPKFGFLKKE